MIAAAEPELPLRAVRTVGREQRFLVLTGHVNPEEPPAARLIVGEQQALSAPELHDPKIGRAHDRIYWTCGLLQMGYAEGVEARRRIAQDTARRASDG